MGGKGDRGRRRSAGRFDRGGAEMSERFELVADEQNKLILKRPGQEDVRDVRVRRSFPWSNPAQYISVRSSEGKELLLIESLSGLSERLRRTIETTLSGTIFIP